MNNIAIIAYVSRPVHAVAIKQIMAKPTTIRPFQPRHKKTIHYICFCPMDPVFLVKRFPPPNFVDTSPPVFLSGGFFVLPTGKVNSPIGIVETDYTALIANKIARRASAN